MVVQRVYWKAAFGKEAVMKPPSRLCLAGVGLICGLYGLFAAGVYITYFSGHFAHVWMVYYGAASGFTIGSGQNGFLTAALLVGGFGLLRRQPGFAGALLGVLTYKPQFWLLVPIALTAARQWRAFASAVIAAAVMALLSLAVLGI